MANFAFTTGKELPAVSNNHVFENVNFCQLEPHTAIFEGITRLVFNNCNLKNCDVPLDAELNDCLHIHVSLCSHLHEKWVEKGLPVCDENCEHVINTDGIWIDGELIDTIYTYQDKETE